MASEPYTASQQAASPLRRLSSNYRSHAHLLELPARLFYEGELRECADRSVTCSLTPWEHARGCALLCWGVEGEHLRELDSVSYFNPLEAARVAELVAALLTSASVRLEQREIGVICAFRKQVLTLRLLLRARGLASVHVGMVYDFQGQEKRCIVVSTTLSERARARATPAVDARPPPLGLCDARRFNVALTRAQALCVVVGHPRFLAHEPFWCDLLRACVDRDAYRGGDAESLADHITASSWLGAGDLDRLNISDLNAFYSGENNWRIAL